MNLTGSWYPEINAAELAAENRRPTLSSEVFPYLSDCHGGRSDLLSSHTTLATQIPEHVCERRKALCVTTERPLTYRCGIPV